MPTREPLWLSYRRFFFFGWNLINWLRKEKRSKIDQTMRHFASIFNFAVYGLILEYSPIWIFLSDAPTRGLARFYYAIMWQLWASLAHNCKQFKCQKMRDELSTRESRNLIKSHSGPCRGRGGNQISSLGFCQIFEFDLRSFDFNFTPNVIKRNVMRHGEAVSNLSASDCRRRWSSRTFIAAHFAVTQFQMYAFMSPGETHMGREPYQDMLFAFGTHMRIENSEAWQRN